MANKRVNKDENLTAALRLRLTESEKEMLSEEAEYAGLSMSELVRRRFFGKKIVAKADDILIKELRRQGGLLKHINLESKGAYSKEVSVAIASITQLIESIAGVDNDI